MVQITPMFVPDDQLDYKLAIICLVPLLPISDNPLSEPVMNRRISSCMLHKSRVWKLSMLFCKRKLFGNFLAKSLIRLEKEIKRIRDIIQKITCKNSVWLRITDTWYNVMHIQWLNTFVCSGSLWSTSIPQSPCIYNGSVLFLICFTCILRIVGQTSIYHQLGWWGTIRLLFGVPDYFGRNKISSGGDLSHYSSASLY